MLLAMPARWRRRRAVAGLFRSTTAQNCSGTIFVSVVLVVLMQDSWHERRRFQEEDWQESETVLGLHWRSAHSCTAAICARCLRSYSCRHARRRVQCKFVHTARRLGPSGRFEDALGNPMRTHGSSNKMHRIPSFLSHLNTLHLGMLHLVQMPTHNYLTKRISRAHIYLYSYSFL